MLLSFTNNWENHMKILFALFISMLFLFGCDHTIQTTSGKAYLSKNPSLAPVPASGGRGLSVEQAIRKAAAVEPTLRFPARIGLARVQGGEITDIPGLEAEAWQSLQGLEGHVAAETDTDEMPLDVEVNHPSPLCAHRSWATVHHLPVVPFGTTAGR